jgi:hypothetical protein
MALYFRAWKLAQYAEIELSILFRHCLNRRIADKETLAAEVAAYSERRIVAPATIDWQFRTADARIKLKRLYPNIAQNQLN